MAGQTLSTGSSGRRRVLFGLLDGDGWTWATLKAAFWFVLIIMLLGYIPDRAYYFTVFSTIDVGVNVISPINFCPPSNRTLPCPAPAGAPLPWDPSPAQLALPGPRTDGGRRPGRHEPVLCRRHGRHDGLGQDLCDAAVQRQLRSVAAVA